MSTRRRRDAHRGEAGLTLVEMMVSVLLAAILSAGLFYMTSGQQRTYNAQIETLQLQESLWGAMEYLKRQVRSAGRGFGACMRGKVYDGDPSTPANAVLHGLRIFNGCSVSGSAAQIDNSSAVDTCTATNIDSPDSFGITVLPERSVAPTPNPGPLAVQVTRQPAGNSLILPIVDGSQVGFPVGDQLIVFPFGDSNRHCVLRRVTGYTPPIPPAQPFGLLQTTSPNSRGDPTTGYLGGTLIVALGTPGLGPAGTPAAPAPPVIPRYFAIDNTKGYPRLITWTSADPTQPSNGLAGGAYDIVAEGIEDMQISWACDVDDDNLLNEGQDNTTRASDEWAFNAGPTDTVPACDWRTPSAVRITLIARTRTADEQYKVGFRPAAEDRGAGTPADDRAVSGGQGTFARRVLTVVVKPQNMSQPRLATP